MSAIHKALSQHEKQSAANHSASFNPLTSPSGKKKGNTLYYLIGLAFLMAAAGLFLVPKPQGQAAFSTSTRPTTIEPDLQPTAQIKVANDVITQQALAQAQDVAPQANIQTDVQNNNALTSEQALATNPVENVDLATPVTIEPVNKNDDIQNTTSAEPPVAADKPTNKVISVKSEASTASNTSIQVEPKTQPKTTIATKPQSSASTVRGTPSVSAATTKVTTNSTTQSTSSVISPKSKIWQQNITTHIANGDIEKAEAELKQWIGASPNDTVPRVWLAKIYINNGFYQAAEPLINQSADKEAQALLGVVYERTNRPALAATMFEGLYRSHPSEGKWLLFWAVNAENSGQVAKSLVLYQNYLQVFSVEDVKLSQFAEQRVNTLQGQ